MHTWSLRIEEMYRLEYPLLLLAVWRVWRR